MAPKRAADRSPSPARRGRDTATRTLVTALSDPPLGAASGGVACVCLVLAFTAAVLLDELAQCADYG